MSTFRIISFDGGGIRGALSAKLFKRLCDKYPTLIENTNMFAGTSTGSLIALALAYGRDPSQIDFFYNPINSKKIFTPSHLNLFRPKYSNKNLKKSLYTAFPKDLLLSDLKKYVLVPAFKTDGLLNNNWQIVFFNNLTQNPTSNFKVIDVALSSSAAPTYFPSHNNFIDGGVILNSPTAASMFSVIHNQSNAHKISDFRILSIGTGVYPQKINANTHNWGSLQWIFSPFSKVKTPLISILLDNNQPLEDFYCKELLSKNYFRLNPIIKHDIQLDDYTKVPLLKLIGDRIDLSDCYSFIENYFLK